MHKDESEHPHLPMKKQTPPEKIASTSYVGMDIAKATLQIHLNGHQIEFKNNPEGRAQLSKKLAKLTLPHVICEATGGYERPVVDALHQFKIPVSVVNPAHTLAASQAQGKRAKTDCCDAEALTDYGQRFNPPPSAPVPPEVREITELTLWLKQLIDNRAVAKTQAEHHHNRFVRQEHQKLLAHYKDQIETTEKEIKKKVQNQKQFQQRLDCLVEINGVGFRTAVMTLVFMPELGSMNRGGAAALAGLAPWTRDSGTMKGKRCIGGGRAQVRPVLYMAALTASRSNPVLAPFYRSLKKREKPSKVALTAVMRKLLLYMNRQLKALAATPSAGELKTVKNLKISKKTVAK
jgi:transposase